LPNGFFGAEAELIEKLEGVTDDLRWKTKIAVAGRFDIHQGSLPNPPQLDNTSGIIDPQGTRGRLLLWSFEVKVLVFSVFDFLIWLKSVGVAWACFVRGQVIASVKE